MAKSIAGSVRNFVRHSYSVNQGGAYPNVPEDTCNIVMFIQGGAPYLAKLVYKYI